MPFTTYYLYLLPGLFSQCGNIHSFFFQHISEKWLQFWHYLLQISILPTNYIEIWKTNSILTFYWGIVDLQCCISFCCTTVIQLYIHNFIYIYMCVWKWSESRSVMSDSLWAHDLYSIVEYILYSPGQNTGVGNLSLLQGIFPTQGSNPGLLHCRQIFLQAEPQVKPKNTGMGSLSLLQ